MRKLALTVCLLLPASTLLARSPFAGIFKTDGITMEITEAGAGRFAGTILARDQRIPFTASEASGALVGTYTVDEEEVRFRATLNGTALSFLTEDESYVLARQNGVGGAAGKRNEPAAAPAASSKRAPPSTSPDATPLRVNRVAIDEKALRQFEQEHRMRIPRGDFWYDKVSGAWGLEGGPTLGLTLPGMNLGGPLRADASRGDTGVFINARELPLQDVIGLQQISVPVVRGRWWVDSAANFGVEGNPIAMGNLLQFSRGRGGAYQRPTAGGYIGGDGETSYFFDPETGSSVMTGP